MPKILADLAMHAQASLLFCKHFELLQGGICIPQKRVQLFKSNTLFRAHRLTLMHFCSL